MKIRVPNNKSFQSLIEYDQIHQYFSGRIVNSVVSANQVIVELSWPSNPLFYIDKDIEDGLEWWGQLPVSEIPQAVRRTQNYQLSLNDNWTLYSWSQWANMKAVNNQKIIVLHIDDHTDCMSPLLFKKNEQNIYFDPLSEKEVNFFNSLSIESAINSGAITIGSFVTLFLHCLQNIEFRHLVPSHRMSPGKRYQSISKTFDQDDLFENNLERPSLKFMEDLSGEVDYKITDDLSVFLRDIPEDAKVLLHVDMDYFNNRFDGDSDWPSHLFTHNPSEAKVLLNIKETFTKVLEIVPKDRIDDVTIALSPGFFPAEFWRKSIEIIDQLF